MKPQDFEKIFEFFRREMNAMEERLMRKLEFSVIELKDSMVSFYKRQDEDYVSLGLRISRQERNDLENSRDIKIIKRKLNLN